MVNASTRLHLGESQPHAQVRGYRARSSVGLALGKDPIATVLLDLKLAPLGQGAESRTFTIGIHKELARELARDLIAAAKASGRDLEQYMREGLIDQPKGPMS